MLDREAQRRLMIAYERALARHDGQNFDALPEAERVLVAIWGLEADVNNGGFDQYFFNGAGNQSFFAATALQIVGAKTMAALVASAIEVFGKAGPAREWSVRQGQVLAFDDAAREKLDALDRAFFEYPEDVSSLVLRYLEANAPEMLLDPAGS